MNTNLSPILDILDEAEMARKEGCLRVCELLSLDPSSPIAHILLEEGNEPGRQRLFLLLKEVSEIVGKHSVKRIITDWPFENFWPNPREPLHSKLLGFFIDPKQQHGCGRFLLNKLLEMLEHSVEKPEHRFPASGCEVLPPESMRIDLCIEGKCGDRKFAIIIENKVNKAINRDEQLQTYVERVHQKRRFEYHEIYVFYLPRTDDRDPDPRDREWVMKCAHYTKITFDKHILTWLNAALKEWPQGHERMLENVSHYRNLIDYLGRKQKERQMNAKILEQLREAEEKNPLPSLSDLEALRQRLDALQQCLQHVVRGKLLLKVQSILKDQRQNVWLCLEDTLERIEVKCPYDARFESQVDVCIYVTDAVSVCFGGNSKHEFWLGYLRSGNPDNQKAIEPLVISEAEKRWTSIKEHPTFYAFVYINETVDEKYVENSSAELARTLIDMRGRLIDRLKDGLRRPSRKRKR